MHQSADVIRGKIEKVPRDVGSAQFGRISASSGKGLVSTSRTYASHRWDGDRYLAELASPAGMPHPKQMFYGNIIR